MSKQANGTVNYSVVSNSWSQLKQAVEIFMQQDQFQLLNINSTLPLTRIKKTKDKF